MRPVLGGSPIAELWLLRVGTGRRTNSKGEAKQPDSAGSRGCGVRCRPAGIRSDFDVILTEAFPMFGLSELAIILIVVIAVIAVRKGPELTRTAGRSARILKAEARAAKDEQAPAEAPGTPRVIPGETVRRENT